MDSSVALAKKKIYREPKLAVYGSLTHMTAAVSAIKSHKDGGANNTKTA
jgi:hypothetical protein